MTRIVCQQLAPRIADLDFNRALSTAAIGDAVDNGADIVVLPELVTSGYMFASGEEAATVAITVDHPVFADWAAAAARNDAIVIGGFCEAGDDGLLYNSAAVVTRNGVGAVYRKLHLWDREKLVFTPGGELPPILETRFGRIGILICYDLEFPELTRTVALAGADLIAVPTNWPLAPRPAGERSPEVQIGMAAARVNHVFIACADRTGTERGQEWTAGTTIIGEDGWILDTATGTHGHGADPADGGPGTVAADVDLSRARDKTWTVLADAFADRRPDFYRAVVAVDADTRPGTRAAERQAR